MKTLGTMAAVALAASLAGPAQNPEPRNVVADVEGCYQLIVGAWAPRRAPLDFAWILRLPSRIRLSPAELRAADSSQHIYVVLAAPGVAWSRHEFASWEVVDSSSIRLTFWAGLSGVTADLKRSASSGFVGEARTFSDDVGSHQARARVAARRIACLR